MAFSSQLFKAPSLSNKPKLRKKTVSSSIFGGASKTIGSSTTIKIPKGMGYRSSTASTVDPKYLAPKSTPIEQTLSETNNILVEIQNQLSADFAYRISQEKELIRRIRRDTSKQKKAEAEKNIEDNKKLGGTIKSLSNKVLSPAISLIDRIKNFFGALIQGFIVDKFLVWFSKKENQKKVEKVFNFIGKNWKVILGIIGGVVIGRVVYKILRIFRALRGAARFLRTGKFNKPQPGGDGGGRRRGGIFKNTEGQRRGVTIGKETQSRVVPGRYNAAGGAVRENVEVITRQKSLISRTLQGVDVNAKKIGRNVIKSLGMGPGQKTLQRSILKAVRPILKRIPFLGAILDFALSVALGEDPGRAAFGAIGAGLIGAMGTFLGGPIGTFFGGIVGDWAGRSLYDLFFKNKGEDPDSKKLQNNAIGFNKGGIVTGKDVGNRDSVLTNLTVGEMVLSRPFMKSSLAPFTLDAYYNGGELINALKGATEEIFESSNSFIKINKDFKEILDNRDISSSNTTSPATSTPPPIEPSPSTDSPTSAQLSPIPISPQIPPGGQGSSGGGTDIKVLPPIEDGGGITPTSAPQGGNSIQLLDAVDENNDYVYYMIEQLGLVGV